MRKITRIIIHQLGLPYGDALSIDRLHRQRTPPFRKIGYHYVILNGQIDVSGLIDPLLVGAIQPGRPIKRQGAHCRDHNEDSIGICLVGNSTNFQPKQMRVLEEAVVFLCRGYQIPASGVSGHGELDNTKPYCPGFDMFKFRQRIVNLGIPLAKTMGLLP